MIILGIVLLVVGVLLGISIIELIGIILAICGAVLLIAGYAGHPVGGRRYWY